MCLKGKPGGLQWEAESFSFLLLWKRWVTATVNVFFYKVGLHFSEHKQRDRFPLGVTAFVTFSCVSSLIFDLSGCFVFICALSYLMSERVGSELVAPLGRLPHLGLLHFAAFLWFPVLLSQNPVLLPWVWRIILSGKLADVTEALCWFPRRLLLKQESGMFWGKHDSVRASVRSFKHWCNTGVQLTLCLQVSPEHLNQCVSK